MRQLASTGSVGRSTALSGGVCAQAGSTVEQQAACVYCASDVGQQGAATDKHLLTRHIAYLHAWSTEYAA
jgi:hypothetical protein